MPLQIRRGTESERVLSNTVFSPGEPVYITDTNNLYIGDGTTPGGVIVGGDQSGKLGQATNTTNSKIEFQRPVKFMLVANDTQRAALTGVEAGMVIFMQSGTFPVAANKLQIFNGLNWININ